LRLAGVLEADFWLRIDVVDADGLGLEQDLCPGNLARGDEILHHFVLRVDGDGLPAGQFREVDAMAGAAEAKLDAVMHQAFALQASSDTGLDQQIDCALLENASANALLDVFTRVSFQNDRINALQMKKVRKRESSGTCSDDSDLGSHQ
jgi:hypothetical protein